MAFVDVRMPPGWDGIETISHLWEADPDLQVVICTAYSDYDLDQIVAKLGLTDKFLVLKKPFDTIEVLQLANACSEKWRLLQRVNQRNRDLEEAEKRYQFLADVVGAKIWTARPDGQVNYINQRLREAVGQPFELTRGWNWERILHPDDVHEYSTRWTQASKNSDQFEALFRLRSGPEGEYRWHCGRAVRRRDQQGQTIQWIGVCVDIDDQKIAEEALKQAQAALEQHLAAHADRYSGEGTNFKSMTAAA
jgi:PAS domain S-box-containing protein